MAKDCPHNPWFTGRTLEWQLTDSDDVLVGWKDVREQNPDGGRP